MTERFQLAANVLLSRRLNHLLRLDESIDIDKSYITCAEYQLFIDEKRAAGENRQPDHWQGYRFPPGDAQKPILGVRARDAEEFCEWLTQKHAGLGVKYRLPTVIEVEENPAIKQQVGYWCHNEKNCVIAGIESQQWQIWQAQFSQFLVLHRDLEGVLNLDLDLYHSFEGVFNLNLDLYLNLDRDLNLDSNLYIYLDLYLNLNLYLDLNCNLDLYRVLALYRNLYRDLNLYLNRVLNRDLNLDLYRDLYRDRDLYLNLDRDLNLYLDRDLYCKIKDGTASNFLLLYFPLLFLIFVYHLLSKIYGAVSQDRNALKTLEISSQKSEIISQKYRKKRDKLYPLYAFLVLLDERQAGRMPAWEGIRIVQERIDS